MSLKPSTELKRGSATAEFHFLDRTSPSASTRRHFKIWSSKVKKNKMPRRSLRAATRPRASRSGARKKSARRPPTTRNSRRTRRLKAGARAPGEDCSICLEPVTPEQWVNHSLILPCGHGFHTPCINGWLAAHDRCPECRGDVPPGLLAAARRPPVRRALVMPAHPPVRLRVRRALFFA